MNRDDDTIFAEALRWHAACDSDSMDWDGFTAWLEADPRHREAYDGVALGGALLADHREALFEVFPAVANDTGEVGAVPLVRDRGWLRWTGLAIAASLVAMLAIPQVMSPSQRFEAGAHSRTIALDDGSTVMLAPRSTLEVEGRHQERMALNGGAWFDVRHDPSRALTIEANGVEISDIGTQFDVQTAGGQVRVEVAEGQVEVRSGALTQPVRLKQGRSLSYDARLGTALVRPVAASDIGEWRSGRLSFDMAPLALVASDLSRYSGVDVTVDESLRDRTFSGTLVINNGDAAVRDLAQLIGLGLAGAAGDYRIEPR